MGIDFSALFESLKTGLVDVAKRSLSDYLDEAIKDGSTIIASMRNDIQNWSTMLANGEIDADNFKSLVLGQKDLLKMDALEHAGLVLIRVDQFKLDICNLLINTVTSIV